MNDKSASPAGGFFGAGLAGRRYCRSKPDLSITARHLSISPRSRAAISSRKPRSAVEKSGPAR